MRFQRHLRVGAFGLALGACGSEPPDPCLAVGPERVVDGLVDHACLHTTAGPFVTIDAPASSEDPSDLPELRNTHTAYTINMAAPVDGKTSRTAAVRVRPRSSGVYATFFSARLPVQVRRADLGVPLCQLEDRDGHGCAGIVFAGSFRLERLQDYMVEIGPTDAARVMLVFEQVTFAEDM
jgi:hypothetical protein